VSSLICDRWQRLNLESRLIAVCAASWYWYPKPRGLCAVGCALGGWPATGSLDGRACAVRPTGARAATWYRETKLVTRNFSHRWETHATLLPAVNCLRDIHLQTIGWPWNWGWGHSRSSEVAPIGSSDITSYSSSIVTVAVACTICEIFAFKL